MVLIAKALTWVNQHTMFLLEATAALGFFIALISILVGITSVAEKGTKLALKKAKKSITARAARPPSSLYRALKIRQGRSVESIGKAMKKIRWLIPPAVTGNVFFVVSTVFASFFLFVFCVNYLQNLLAGIISVLACILTFSQAFSLSTKRSVKAEEYTKQLPSSIRILGAVLSDTENFNKAIESAAERSPYPVKNLFEKVYEKINDGESPAEALRIIPMTLKTSHSEILANVLSEAYKHGTAALPMFITLADQIDNNHKLELKNKSFLIPARITRLIMHVFIIIMVAITTFIVPDAHKYIVDPMGKMLVTLYFVTVVVSVVADKMFGMVDG